MSNGVTRDQMMARHDSNHIHGVEHTPTAFIEHAEDGLLAPETPTEVAAELLVCPHESIGRHKRAVLDRFFLDRAD